MSKVIVTRTYEVEVPADFTIREDEREDWEEYLATLKEYAFDADLFTEFILRYVATVILDRSFRGELELVTLYDEETELMP